MRQTLLGGNRITSSSFAARLSGIGKYPIPVARRVFSLIDLPKKTIFRLNLIAASTHCLIREMLEEKVVIKNFPFVFRISSSKVCPTIFSDRVKPSRSAPRQSDKRHKTPSRPALVM